MFIIFQRKKYVLLTSQHTQLRKWTKISLQLNIFHIIKTRRTNQESL